MAKDKVLDDDDTFDLPEGVGPFDVEPVLDHQEDVDYDGFPYQLSEDEPKAKPATVEEEEEDEPKVDPERESLVTQLAELRRQVTDKSKDVSTAVSIALEGINLKEENLAEKLKKAREDNDTAEELSINRAVGELATIRKSLQSVKEQSERPSQASTFGGGGQNQNAPLTPNSNLAGRWQAQNAAWIGDASKRPQLAFLQALDAQLAQEGRNPHSEDYFQELSRRMSKQFPDLGVRHLDGKAPASGQRQRGGNGTAQPVATQRVQGAQAQPNKNRVQITADDIRIMKKLKLDPTNKDVLKEYAKNKASTSPYMR